MPHGAAFAAGQAVQTPLGKGVVLDLRNNGRVLVEVKGRSVLFTAEQLTALRTHAVPAPRGSRDSATLPAAGDPAHAALEVDLHGLTVAEALERAEQSLNSALLAGATELRVIHGRSGGRIRAALHQRLGVIAAVRGFHVDPRNAGVTIVEL